MPMAAALSTSPNSAIPAGLRRRTAQDADIKAAKGHAAGILFVAPDGDVLLLHRASTEPNYGAHWALPGGKAEEGEAPSFAADRETKEEIGDVPAGKKKVLDQRITPTGMAFHTFAQAVPSKFVPKLNAEHSGYTWASLDKLPGPLHPAVKQTLTDRLGMADDMKPEDWQGLRDGFLKWTAEEEAEPEHAQDAMLALDRDSVRTLDKDGRLHIEVAHISKAMVCPYKGSEIPNAKALGLDEGKVYQLLRDPDELAKAAPTFNNQPLLSKHVPVTAPNYDEKIKPYIIGSTGTDCIFNAPYLDNNLVVWSGDSIQAIDDDEQKEISCGYHYRAEMTPGNFHGIAYDGVMRDIVGNHVALVKYGRAGPDVVVGDSMENLMSKPTRFAANALLLTAGYLNPVLAKDAKINLLPIFKDIKRKDFKAKPVIMALDAALKGKLAQDADMSHVAEMLDHLEHSKGEAGEDESVSEPQHKAMEAAAHGNSTLGIPKKVGAEFANADKGKAFDAEPLKAFLKEKGMGDEDIKAACDMVGGMAEVEDEEDEEAKKKLEAEKAKAEDEAKIAKDAMKDMVTKPAMDAALKQTAEATAKTVRETERGIRIALAEVRPYVGELAETLAFDSGDDVRRHALTMLGVEGAKTMHPEALKTVLSVQRKPGARPVDQDPPLGMDAAASKSFNDRFGTDRIGAA